MDAESANNALNLASVIYLFIFFFAVVLCTCVA